jgi:hypothetical protein
MGTLPTRTVRPAGEGMDAPLKWKNKQDATPTRPSKMQSHYVSNFHEPAPLDYLCYIFCLSDAPWTLSSGVASALHLTPHHVEFGVRGYIR